MPKAPFYTLLLLLGLASACQGQSTPEDKLYLPRPAAFTTPGADGKVHKSRAEWKKVLAPEEYYVMFEAGTERAWTGHWLKNPQHGVYYCNACHNALFSSDTKFDSQTGWPSYYQPISKTAVDEKTDPDGSRVEVNCHRCGAHLGHVFDDGQYPDGKRVPTGLRYCMNSLALTFSAK